jgi:hypothetical protein
MQVLPLLTIHVPNSYIPERTYIIKTIMQDFLGIDIQLVVEERYDVLIQDNRMEDESLRIADILFQTPGAQWLTPGSLPEQPLNIWDTTDFHKFAVVY